MNVPNRVFFVMGCVFLLTACGGSGSSGTTSATPSNTANVSGVASGTELTAPELTSLSTTLGANSTLTFKAVAKNAAVVTGYCFSKEATPPVATNSCFQQADSLSVPMQSPMPRYYVWAKGSSGLVSSTPLVGPCSQAGYLASDASQKKTVCMMTTLGEMVFELEAAKAPVTVANFLTYVNEGFYANTTFHRVEKGFVVQGGGYTYSGTGGYVKKVPTHSAINLELPQVTGISNVAYTIGMARGGDLNSATSEFFVNMANNASLDTVNGGYAAFGRIISGKSVADAMQELPLTSVASVAGLRNPVDPPIIRWAVQLK